MILGKFFESSTTIGTFMGIKFFDLFPLFFGEITGYAVDNGTPSFFNLPTLIFMLLGMLVFLVIFFSVFSSCFHLLWSSTKFCFSRYSKFFFFGKFSPSFFLESSMKRTVFLGIVFSPIICGCYNFSLVLFIIKGIITRNTQTISRAISNAFAFFTLHFNHRVILPHGVEYGKI